MATVNLSGIWVHEDVGPHLRWRQLRALSALTRTSRVDGSVWTTASGRQLARRRPGTPSQWEVQVRVGRDDADWLRARIGRRLGWRDYAGHLVWAVCWELPEVEFYNVDHRLVDVTLTLHEVDAPYPYRPGGDPVVVS